MDWPLESTYVYLFGEFPLFRLFSDCLRLDKVDLLFAFNDDDFDLDVQWRFPMILQHKTTKTYSFWLQYSHTFIVHGLTLRYAGFLVNNGILSDATISIHVIKFTFKQ